MALHWYFSSALPRALLGALPLALLGGVLDRRVRPSLAIALAFVALYSALPHKEVRTMMKSASAVPASGSCDQREGVPCR